MPFYIGSSVVPLSKDGIRLGKVRTLVRETPCYWIDSSGDWWCKKTALRHPKSATGMHLAFANARGDLR